VTVAPAASSAGSITRRGKLWPVLLMLIGGTVGFVAVAADLLWHGQLYRWDDPVRIFLHEHSTPMGVIFFSSLSFLGEYQALLPFGLVGGGYLFLRGRYYPLGVWAFTLLGCAALNETLKKLFKVPRPDRYTYYAFPPHEGYSFPSGHTMGVAVMAGAIILFAAHLGLISRKQTFLAAAAAVVLSLAVAFALMYMGVHTLTDVLGGLAVSTAWVGVIGSLLTVWPLEPVGSIKR